MIKFSIIIPIYNAAKYLNESIESAIKQTMPSSDYEIILVNNGSTDESMEIAQRYTELYENITLITYKKNRGITGGTNVGLRTSNGTYIYILHADDSIDEDLLNTCYERMELNNLDIVCFGSNFWIDYNQYTKDDFMTLDDCDDIISICNEVPENKVLSGKEFFGEKHWVGAEWQCAFNRKFLINNNLYYDENILLEDYDYMIRAYMKAEKTMSIHKVLHKYRITPKSTNSTWYDEKLLESYKDLIIKFFNIVKEENSKEVKIIKSFKKYFFMEFNDYLLAIKKVIKNEKELNLAKAANIFVNKYIDVFGYPETINEYQAFQSLLETIYEKNETINVNIYLENLNENIKCFFINCKKILEDLEIQLIRRIPFNNLNKKIGIYGLGNHTKALLECYRDNIGDVISGITFIDSYKGYDKEMFEGNKVLNINQINNYELDCIVISSSTYEEELYLNVKNIIKKDIPIYRFYEDKYSMLSILKNTNIK